MSQSPRDQLESTSIQLMAEPPRDQIDGVNTQLGAVREEVDGVRETVDKMQEYLREAIKWIRILIITIICICLVGVLVYNFFAPKEKDVPDHIIAALRNALIDTGGVAGFPFPFPKIISTSNPTTITDTHNSSWIG